MLDTRTGEKIVLLRYLNIAETDIDIVEITVRVGNAIASDDAGAS